MMMTTITQMVPLYFYQFPADENYQLCGVQIFKSTLCLYGLIIIEDHIFLFLKASSSSFIDKK
jgi:hypothetical protein